MLVSAITGCVSIYTFASFVGFSIRISSSAVGLKVCSIAKGIKKYKSIIKQKKKKHDKVLLEKVK